MAAENLTRVASKHGARREGLKYAAARAPRLSVATPPTGKPAAGKTRRALRRRSALALVSALLLATLLAACQLPAEPDPWGTALEPDLRTIRGLTPEHARTHPHAMHLSPEGDKLFVALPGTIARPDNRIAIVDLGTGRLDGHIRVGVRPLAFAADPLHPQQVFIAHPYSPSITILNTTTQSVTQLLTAPYYIEGLAITPNGARLLGTDRAGDRLIVWDVERDEMRLRLEEAFSVPTGPNPEHVILVPPPARATWENGRIAALTDRHGASVTLVDLETRNTQRVPTGGAPLALAARDGLVFIAGIGPGDGTPASEDGTLETGSADLSNSILVLDLRSGPQQVTATPVPQARYLSATAPIHAAPSPMRILGGALPSHLEWQSTTDPATGNETTRLWVAHHATDQVQVLDYTPPPAGEALTADTLRTPSRAHGLRLTHHDPGTPLGPTRLTDTTHGLYETPPGPRGSATSGDLLLVIAQLTEQLLMLNLADCPGPASPNAPCTTRIVDLVTDPIPYPSGIYERGERLFYSALPSADQQRSCASCHIGGLATGGTWGLPHRDNESVRIPRLDQVPELAPWLLDGSVTRPEQYLRAAGGDMLRADPDDPHNLAARTQIGTQRNGTASDQNETHPDDTPYGVFPGAADRLGLLDANATDAQEWMRLTFAYAMGETRLLPPPPGLSEDRDLARGAELWDSLAAGCAGCHIGGERARSLTQEELEGAEMPFGVDTLKAPPLDGIWDRHGTALFHDGRARTVIETLLPPAHDCLEAGETGQAPAWHRSVADRTCDAIKDLAAYVLVLDARR